MVLDLWRCEQNHAGSSPYYFIRKNCPPTDTLSHGGKGAPVAVTGMTWSGFRPSDDACVYGYLIPSNMFASVVLGYLKEIFETVYHDDELAARASALRAEIDEGIRKYGIVEHEEFGKIYAYETDGMGNYTLMGPLMTRQFTDSREAFDFIESTAIVGDVQDVYEFDRLVQLITSGFAAILIDGIPAAIVMGAQGFAYRSVSEPESEVNEKGSRESFTEPVKINITLIRRRMKSGEVCFEMLDVGTRTKTSACLVYSPGAVDPRMLEEVRRRLSAVNLPLVLDTGYLQPYLEGKTLSLFSEVGSTERPDTVCADGHGKNAGRKFG